MFEVPNNWDCKGFILMKSEKFKEYTVKLKTISMKYWESFDELSAEERKLINAIKNTKYYLKVYDATEYTNKELVFNKLFLESKNRQRTLVAIASDVGLCPRGLNRMKKELLTIFSFIYENM